jgi:hypothetical protein
MQNQTLHSRKYRAFLLRCWSESEVKAGHTIWRFSLEPVGSDRRLGFNNLEALIEFLKNDIFWQEEERKD